MLKLDMPALVRHANAVVLRHAAQIRYSVADLAPTTIPQLLAAPSLVIWSGASDGTIFDDAKVNYAFRALHDTLHIATRIGFTVAEEIALGRLQAAQYSDSVVAELVYCEVAGQAMYFHEHGSFVPDQKSFSTNWLQRNI